MASSWESAGPAGELLPATRRALTHRVAVGQAEGRTPSLVGTVDHLDLGSFVFTRESYDPDAPLAARPDPEGWRGF